MAKFFHLLNLALMVTLASSCKNSGGESSLDSNFMNPYKDVVKREFKSNVNSIEIDSNSIKLLGVNLDEIENVRIKTSTAKEIPIEIISKTAGVIVGKATKSASFAINELLSIVIGNAYGQATIDATFSIANRSINVNQLAGALGGVASDGTSKIKNGQTLKWYQNNWVVDDVVYSPQTYIGTWDVDTQEPAIELTPTGRPNPTVVTPRNGDYYVVQGHGRASLNCQGTGCDQEVSTGDWVVWNDKISKWDINKKAEVILPVEIPWANINKSGSKLTDMADVGGTPLNGKSLVYSSQAQRWVFANPVLTPGSVSGGPSGSISAGSITSVEIQDNSIRRADLNLELDGLLNSFVVNNITSQVVVGGVTAASVRSQNHIPTSDEDVITKKFWDSWQVFYRYIGEAFYSTKSLATLAYTYDNNSGTINLDNSNSIIIKKQTADNVVLGKVANGGVYTFVFQDVDSNNNTNFSVFSYGNTAVSVGGTLDIRWNPARAARTPGKHAMYTVTLMAASGTSGVTPNPVLYVSWTEF